MAEEIANWILRGIAYSVFTAMLYARQYFSFPLVLLAMPLAVFNGYMMIHSVKKKRCENYSNLW